MAYPTVQDIITILEGGVFTYPYELHYFSQKQKFTVTASVEVIKTQSPSTTEDVIKKETNFTFDVSVYTRYTRSFDVEEADLTIIENEMISLLEASDLQGSGKIFLETKTFSRTPIDQPWYGMVSKLRITIKDVTSTDGSGQVGAYDILQLNSDTTPVNIQLIDKTWRDGRGLVEHTDDIGLIYRDPTKFNLGSISVTYENTPSVNTLIYNLASNAVQVKGKIMRASGTTNYLFWIGDTVKSSGYSDVERATTNITIEGTW